jgi:hypothetical protein
MVFAPGREVIPEVFRSAKLLPYFTTQPLIILAHAAIIPKSQEQEATLALQGKFKQNTKQLVQDLSIILNQLFWIGTKSSPVKKEKEQFDSLCLLRRVALSRLN